MTLDHHAVGALVIADGGDAVGRIAEVRGRAFRVNAPLESDFWLDVDCVRAKIEGEVVLAIDRRHLREHRQLRSVPPRALV